MPLPLAVVGAMAVGAGVNMAIGYVVETRTRIGDGNYSGRDALIDGVVGATGYGSLAKGANYTRKGMKAGKAAKRAKPIGPPSGVGKEIMIVDDFTIKGIRQAPISKTQLEIHRRVNYQNAGLHAGVWALAELAKGNDGARSSPGKTSIIRTDLNGTNTTVTNPITVVDIHAASANLFGEAVPVTKSRTKTKGKRAPSWCPKHKKYDYCR